MAKTGKKRVTNAAPGIMLAMMVLLLIGMLIAVIVMMKRQKAPEQTDGPAAQIAEQQPESSAAEVTDTNQTTITEQTTTTTAPLPPGSVTGISLSFYSATMNIGDNAIMPIVTMLPDDAADRSEAWESDNPAVAEVDEIGKITAVGAGSCTVRVTSVSNPKVFAEVQITVKEGAASTTTLPMSTPPQTDPLPETAQQQTSPQTSRQTAPNTSATAGTGTPQTSAATESASSSAAPGTTETQPAAPRSDIKVINGITYVQGVLIANKTYGLPASYNPGGLDPKAQAAFNEMAAAAAKEGLSLRICSGFRSYATQKTLYNNYCKRDGQAAADRYSARPGHSEHQTGLAMDINYAGSSFDKTPEAKWIAENCWKYGFIIRYPKGKEDITGYKYESWHVRYLGKEWAKTIFDSGLTLEEYFGITSKYAS